MLPQTLRFQPTYEELKPCLLSTPPRQSLSSSFQPTYEELKLGIGFFCPYCKNSFQPTYEELKQKYWDSRRNRPPVFSLPMRNWNKNLNVNLLSADRVFSLLMRNWNLHLLLTEQFHLGFQPTYEELKLMRKSRHVAGFSVFSLPMRNWNPGEILLPCPGKVRFSAYLWGIETFLHGGRKLRPFQFSAYLWGIETWESSVCAWDR